VSTAWWLVLTVGVASIVLKGIGPVLLGGRPLPARLAGVVTLLAPTLLAALIVVAVFDGGGRLTADARLVGVGAALIALWLRAPTLLVVAVAAVTTALTRLLL
jgi:hypothetical protein